MSVPLFVMTKVAEPVLIPLHAPVADRDGAAPAAAGGGGLVGVLVGVFVGVLTGRFAHEPTAFNVTEERKDVL